MAECHACRTGQICGGVSLTTSGGRRSAVDPKRKSVRAESGQLRPEKRTLEPVTVSRHASIRSTPPKNPIAPATIAAPKNINIMSDNTILPEWVKTITIPLRIAYSNTIRSKELQVASFSHLRGPSLSIRRLDVFVGVAISAHLASGMGGHLSSTGVSYHPVSLGSCVLRCVQVSH